MSIGAGRAQFLCLKEHKEHKALNRGQGTGSRQTESRKRKAEIGPRDHGPWTKTESGQYEARRAKGKGWMPEA